MKIRLLCVGKLGHPHLKALAGEYQTRLDRLTDLEIVETKDGSEKEGSLRLAREAERLMAVLGPPSQCVLWDEGGEALGSVEFSAYLQKLEGASVKRLTFVIGSSHGIDPALKALIPRKFALSRLTLTHEWARVLFLEQLYRANCIKRKIPYHH